MHALYHIYRHQMVFQYVTKGNMTYGSSLIIMATIVGLQTHKGTAELGMMKNLRKMLPQGLHIRLDQEILYGPTHGYQF